jgi:hypothetical protein
VGLGAAIAKMDREVEAEREADDAHIIGELRKDFDEIMKGPDAKMPTRANVARLFRTIVDRLRPSMSIHLVTLKRGGQVVTDHPAIALLCEFLDYFGDIDSGKLHAIFKPAPHGATAALTAKQREQDRIWLKSVDIIKRRYGLPTKSAAERLLAVKLRKAGKTRRGKPVSARTLKSLRDHLRR